MLLNQNNKQLISIKNIFIALFPLTLSWAAKNIMTFVDRVIISRYSLEAMTVVTTSGVYLYAISGTLSSIIYSSVILIGKANGAQKYSDVIKPVWTMCLASFLITPVYIVCACYIHVIPLPDFCYKHIDYLKLVFGLGFLDLFVASLSCFYIGIGKNGFIFISNFISNIFNACLAMILIFGWKFIPSLGIKGAAIATALAQLLQVIMLLFRIFGRDYIEKYYTNIITFSKTVFNKCISLGAYIGIFCFLEILNFLSIIYVQSLHGVNFSTVLNVGIIIYVLFNCYINAVDDVAMSIASNLIGAKKYHLIKKLHNNITIINCIFYAVLIPIMIIFPQILVNILIHNSAKVDPIVIEGSLIVIKYVWVCAFLRSIYSSLKSILFSFGDVKFSIIVLIIAILIYLGVILFIFFFGNFQSYTTWQMEPLYAITLLLLSYRRFLVRANFIR